jgi:outer membrane protein OmpA-like peptidoglycan-associated protein
MLGCLPNDLPTQATVNLIAAQQAAGSAPEATAPAISRSNNTMPQAPFLRRPIWFDPNSPDLNPRAADSLHRDASWLKVHAESRILIVGSCDKSGSESCTHTLAEARGTAVKKFLESCGVSPDQIVGVKAWDVGDDDCRVGDSKCQQKGRNTQLLLAPSASK